MKKQVFILLSMLVRADNPYIKKLFSVGYPLELILPGVDVPPFDNHNAREKECKNRPC